MRKLPAIRLCRRLWNILDSWEKDEGWMLAFSIVDGTEGTVSRKFQGR